MLYSRKKKKKKLIWFLDDGIEENKISKPKK